MSKISKKIVLAAIIVWMCVPSSVLALMQSQNFRIFEANPEGGTTPAVGPVISGVASTATDSTATVSWTTSDLSDAFVIFDTNSAFTSSREQGASARDSLSHTVTVTGLNPSTTYYFRVRSTNVGGGTTVNSNNYSFTTAAATPPTPTPTPTASGGMLIIDKTDKFPPEIKNVSVEGIRADNVTVAWQTNEPATSFVEFSSASIAQMTQGVWEAAKIHKVTLLGLLPDTEYSFRALSSDGSGNMATSSTMTFKTLTLEEEVKIVQEEQAKNPTSTPPVTPEDTLQSALQKALDAVSKFSSKMTTAEIETTLIGHLNALRGLITGAAAPSIIGTPRVVVENDRATIYWQTDKESGSQLAYAPEKLYKGGSPEPYLQVIGNPDILTTNHQAVIYGLAPGETYYYQLRNKSALGITGKSKNYVFNSVPTAPGITNFYVDIISPEHAIFRWLTSQETDASLRHIPYRGTALAVAEAKTFSDKGYSIIHQIDVNDLEGGVVYQVELAGKTKKNEVVSKVIPEFSTSKDDLPPEIDQVKTEIAIVPGKEDRTQAIVSWITNEPATSHIYYVNGAKVFEKDQAEQKIEDPNYTKKHVAIITKFVPGQVYSFRVESTDTSGNASLSKVYAVSIPKKRESIFEMILRIFLEIFGWVGKIGA